MDQKRLVVGLLVALVFGLVAARYVYIQLRNARMAAGKQNVVTGRIVVLPRAPGQSAVPPREARTVKPGGGTERILLVEDDDSVRRFVRSTLEGAGYVVFSAESGMAALEKLNEMATPPDLLLTDVVMPGMDGRVLAQDITRRLPGTHVLFISGYSDVSAEQPEEPGTSHPLLQKPFSPQDLLGKVREILTIPLDIFANTGY